MQYQLQYDNEGTASLKEIDAIPTRKVSEGTFNVSEYFAPRIDYGITETYADTFSPEKQLELIQKKLLGKDSGNDKDDSTYKKNLSPEFDWKTYTYNEYVKALGEDTANDWLNYSNIADNVGPSYGEDITKGTIYDAEDPADDWDPSGDGIMSKPEPISVPVPAHISGGGNGNQGNTGSSSQSNSPGHPSNR